MRKKDSALFKRHRTAHSHQRDKALAPRKVLHSSTDHFAPPIQYPNFSDYELIQTRTLTHDGVKILTPLPRGALNNPSAGTTYLSRALALEMRLLALRAGRA